jgi:hypothetical protein
MAPFSATAEIRESDRVNGAGSNEVTWGGAALSTDSTGGNGVPSMREVSNTSAPRKES